MDSGRSGSHADRLAHFRATHKPRGIVQGTVPWRYVVGGSGTQTLLLLTGALGVADFGFELILGLERAMRVIAPDYPPLTSLGELVDGLSRILDAEEVARAPVLGGSYGGLLAQEFVRRHPHRACSLILSHTGAPDGVRRRGVASILSLVPVGILRWMMVRRLRGALAEADPFWTGYLERTIGAMSKADLRSRIALAAEFGGRRYSAGDLSRWDGRVLIIDADNDPLMKPRTRAAVRALYANADRHTFRGTGHAAGLREPERYAEVVRSFVEAGPSAQDRFPLP